MHTHAVIPNLVCREDGVWVAIDATALYRWAKAAGSVYQEELRRRLSARLGVGWGPDRNGCREMTGLSEAQLRAFSKRTAQIEAHLAATGQVLTDRKARMQADEAASLATRARKDRSLTPAQLRGRWDREAAAAGLPVGDALLAAVTRPAPVAPIGRAELRALFDRLVDPEAGLCAHGSRFGEAQVIEAVAAWGAGRLTVADDRDTVAGVPGVGPGGASGQPGQHRAGPPASGRRWRTAAWKTESLTIWPCCNSVRWPRSTRRR